MLLIRADCIERFDTYDTDDRAENVCLFEIQVNQVGRLLLDKIDRLLDMIGR